MSAPLKNNILNRSSLILNRFLDVPSLPLDVHSFPYEPFHTDEPFKGNAALEIPSNLMIGKQAEQCFQHYLQISPRYELLASNIQVQGTTETVGELDYLVYDQKLHQTLHVELACKFYLLNPREQGLAAWIGPNRKDSLEWKLKKLKQKQFPLLFKEETKATLFELGITTSDIVQQLCLKAFLFIPHSFTLPDVSVPWQPLVIGEWMNLVSFKALDPTALYAFPQKTAWLLPPKQCTHWISYEEIISLIEIAHSNKKTPLIYQKINGALKLFFITWWN